MSVYFIHAPYMKESRDKLLEMQTKNVDIVYTERWYATDDKQYDFTDDLPYIDSVPCVILVDDDGKSVLTRASLNHITKENIDWMHTNHASWKSNGRKDKFPNPPWSKNNQ